MSFVTAITPPSSRNSELPPASVARSSRRGGAVMIVDDEEAIRCAASVILEANGFTTITAANGFEALLKLHEGANVSVILLDLRMPAMDGQETFRHLRLNWPEIPVIIASGYHPRELGIQFEGEPPDGFLQKPFTFASISAAVHKALEFTTSASALV